METKIVVFDFDGTLTNGNTNAWLDLWDLYGYKLGDGKELDKLFGDFYDGNLVHEEWNNRTMEVLFKDGLKQADFDVIAQNTPLKKGVTSLFIHLKFLGYKVCVLSGGFNYIIKRVINKYAKNNNFTSTFIDKIYANRIHFNDNGKAKDFITTSYDDAGKADFITEICKEYSISPKDVMFVGNGWNDKDVKKSGAHTLCITPEKGVNYKDKNSWDDFLLNVDTMLQILGKTNPTKCLPEPKSQSGKEN